jgi:hypothetical protein
MVPATVFHLSVKLPRRHETALWGLAAACPQATTASSLFPLFRVEAETLRPRNLAAQVGVAGGRLNGHRANRAGALSAMRQRAAGARGFLATQGVVPFRPRAAEGFAACVCRRHVQDRQGDRETRRQGEKRAPNDSCVLVSWSPGLLVSWSPCLCEPRRAPCPGIVAWVEKASSPGKSLTAVVIPG